MKKKLQQLLAEGKTKQAIQLLLEITKGTDKHNSVILQSARYKDYEKNRDEETTSFEQQKLSLAKVNTALLNIVNDLTINDKDFAYLLEEMEQQEVEASNKTTKTKVKQSKKDLWKTIGKIALIIGILAGIARISGCNLKDVFFNKKPDSFSVTVLVHGKKGKDDKILAGQGKVILDIGGDRKEEEINAQGEATFKELPKGYENQMSLISINHPQPYKPVNRNKEYKLTSNEVIYLEVELKGINKIKGRVIDFTTENYLDSVRVSIENVATLTDEFGWFELEIPEDIQAKFVSANFFKAGYAIEDLDSIAPHTNQSIEIALKKK